MADNVTTQSTTPATPPAGEVIAADDVGGVKHQRVKISLGADGTATDLAPGQTTMANSVPVTIASNQTAVPTSLASLPALAASTANIGDVDVLTVPADPFGTNADAAATAGGAGSHSAKLRLMTTQLNSILSELQGLTVAEDFPHASTDPGIMFLGVRKDVAGSLTGTDGDYTPPQFDSSGNLRVTGSSGVTEYTEGATDASITGVAMLWEDASDTLRVPSAANPLPIQGTLSITGEDHMGKVSGNMSRIQPTMAITAGAYAAGEVIGGELTLTNAMRVTGGTGMLHKLTVVDKANVKPELRCLLFDSNPAGTFADNGLMTINAADYDNILSDLHIASTDYVTFDDAGTDWNIATLRNIGDFVAAVAGSRDLYAVFVAVGTPTFTSTSQLVPTFWFANN